MESYCAKIENGVVASVIVCGSAEWAAANLGGEWIFTADRLVCVGWILVDGDIVPPPDPVE